MLAANVSTTLQILFCLGLQLSAQESYKYKTTPKIPYQSAADESFINGPFADKITNDFNCSASRSATQKDFLPVCALLPDNLVKCNPLYFCQHDTYLRELEKSRNWILNLDSKRMTY